MAKITQEQVDKIIQLYQNLYVKGKITKKSIAEECKCSIDTVNRTLERNGLKEIKLSSKLQQIADQVEQEFLSGKYCKDIATEFNIDEHSVYKILDTKKIKRQTGYHSNCIENYFEQIDTPDKAYLLGFITADGAIVNEILSIEIKDDDIQLLEYAKQQINPQATITKCNGRSTSKITFGAKQIGRDLAKYGIIQNKSKTIKEVPIDLIPNNLLPYYFRGLIDGDGSISEQGRISIYSGSEEYIKNVQNILIKEINVSELKIYHGTTYFVSWSSLEDRKKIFHYLYDNLDKAFYYKRKYQRLYDSLNQANTEVTS